MGKRSLILAATASAAAAQSQLAVQAPGTAYQGFNLTGYHVGAGTSYETVGTVGAGDGFVVNGTLTDSSHYLLDSSIVSGYSLPCCFINQPTISSNAGPLQCGAASPSGPNDYCNAYPGTLQLGFAGIASYWVCSAQSSTYGYVPSTIVGLFSSSGASSPSGPGLQNCVPISYLTFGATNPPYSAPASSSSTTMPTPSPTASSMTVPPPAPTNGTVPPPSPQQMTTITITSKYCDLCEETVYVTTCPVAQASNYIAVPTGGAIPATNAASAPPAGSPSAVPVTGRPLTTVPAAPATPATTLVSVVGGNSGNSGNGNGNVVVAASSPAPAGNAAPSSGLACTYCKVNGSSTTTSPISPAITPYKGAAASSIAGAQNVAKIILGLGAGALFVMML